MRSGDIFRSEGAKELCKQIPFAQPGVSIASAPLPNPYVGYFSNTLAD